jgi:hypothetical protein
MGALVDFPMDEAEALVKRTAPDGRVSMSAAECTAAERARARLAQAIAVERGAGGEATLKPDEALCEGLIGQRVRVQTTYGSVITGRLERLSGFRSLIIIGVGFQKPINLSLVESIEVERVAV